MHTVLIATVILGGLSATSRELSQSCQHREGCVCMPVPVPVCVCGMSCGYLLVIPPDVYHDCFIRDRDREGEKQNRKRG